MFNFDEPFDELSDSQKEEIQEMFTNLSAAFNEFLDDNGLLVEASSTWSKERLALGKQAFYMLHVALHPESFGIEDNQ